LWRKRGEFSGAMRQTRGGFPVIRIILKKRVKIQKKSCNQRE
jgi:hypothetical protein